MANSLGILGKKLGMTRVFGPGGKIIPVTVVAAGPCPIMQIKTDEKEGYNALQVAFGKDADRKANKPTKGHQAKAGKGYFRHLREFRLDKVDEYEVGQELTIDMFKPGERVKVSGTSKGKGFQGAMKRWNFRGLRASHGAEKVHRSVGSVGNAEFPGKIFKGKKMPGQMGNARVTYSNAEIFDIRPDENIILIRGQVPGPKDGLIMIRKKS